MKVDSRQWREGKTFSDYLDEHHISRAMIETISKEDQKFLLEIRSDYNYYELLDDDGHLEQALIPISREMQIHLFRNPDAKTYGFDIIPIVYKDKEYFGRVIIASNPYNDTLNRLKYPKLAERLSRALKSVININRLHPGDEIDFVYRQRTRLGHLYTAPDIQIARVRSGRNETFIYVDEDGAGYKAVSQKWDSVTGRKKVVYTRRINPQGKVFGMPLRHIRITSSFSYRRWHPILHRYRPHHGTDFGARRGTPLLAVNDGKVIYARRMGTYGNVVKIRHAGGYVSLYAHQSRIRAKRGQYVRKGQIIGYVGSTGRSTGPHLHFGLTRNGHWVDPMKVLGKKSVKGGRSVFKNKNVSASKNMKSTQYKKVEIRHAQENKKHLEAYLKDNTPSYIWGKEYFQKRVKDEELLEDVQ